MNDASALLLMSGLLLVACGTNQQGADIVLRNTFVYTVDSTTPRAQAIAVADGRIVYVGSDEGVAPFIGRATRVLSLPGRMVMPGFVDTHVHLVTGGMELLECNLNPAETVEELKAIITGCAATGSRDEWVRGGGFALPLFKSGLPDRALLDLLVPDRPAFFSSADAHTGWANSRALEIAGITSTTEDPPNGRIERASSGVATGTLRETAQELVTRHFPAYRDEDYLAGLQQGLALASEFGITSVQEANADESILRAYAQADSSGRLSVRALINLRVNPREGPQQVSRLAALRDAYGRGLVRPVGVKIFLDGVIEGQTAALLEPYVDRPGYLGELNVPQAQLDALVHALDSAGFKVHVHAIGDRAIRTALDAFAAQQAQDSGAGPRHVIVHIQLFDLADIGRFAELGVVASFQPFWAYRDSYMRDLTEPRLGPRRSKQQYPIRRMINSGAIVAGGSDWSVSSMNPLDAIQVAVTRRALSDSTGPAFIPEERIQLADALHMYTMGGSMAGDDEHETGSLTVGKAADLIVLSHDLFQRPAHQIASTRVMFTMMGGHVTHEDSLIAAGTR